MVEDDYLFYDAPQVGNICEASACRCSSNQGEKVNWIITSIEEFETITDIKDIAEFKLTHHQLEIIPDEIILFECIVRRGNHETM